MRIKIPSAIKSFIDRRLNELSALYEVGKLITSTLDLNEALRLITNRTVWMMHADACSLRLLDDSEKELVLKSYLGPNRQAHLKNIKVGRSIAGRAIKYLKPYVVEDITKEPRYLSRAITRREKLRSLLVVPLMERGRAIGVLSVYSKNRSEYNHEHVDFLNMLAQQAAVAISNARLFEEVKTSYLKTIKLLTNVIDAKDSYTFGHSEKVMKHAVDIAKSLNLTEDLIDAVKYASYLHDLGKISVDGSILRKKDKLNTREWREVSRHPEIGARIVKQIGFLNNISPIILYHHLKYCGGGYPKTNLSRSRIPIGARILAVADAYEAMLSDRPYRSALTEREAARRLKIQRGKQFDPKVVNTFLRILEREKR